MSKVKNLVLLNNIELEDTEANTQAAEDRAIVDTYFSKKLNLTTIYKTGVGETGTACKVKVWGYVGSKSESTEFPYSSSTNKQIANDEENWVQIGTYEIGTGTATFTPVELDCGGGAADTTYKKHFLKDITFSKIRVSAFESGTPTNKGILKVIASIQ